MTFNSLIFIIFFLAVYALHLLLPSKFRWMVLLTASCYFYMAFIPIYILILGFTIIIDYLAAIYIEKAAGRLRKLFLIFSLIANIGVLAVFKYYNFLNENLSSFLHGFGLHDPFPYLSILLPIGLSFHTFQAMSYTIEVYRGHQKAERHFGFYALYVMFFPQLVAGPIERPQHILPQLKNPDLKITQDDVLSGFAQALFGFFKKVVVADTIAIQVENIYDNYQYNNGITLLVATYLFAFQIYCDFSGYSDIAVGIARMMGFELMQNFRLPYFSKSVTEFWRRWHISLSTWLRDYLYISLGGNRKGKHRTYFNLIITMLLGGLWHGASWTFVVWGGLNGFYLAIERIMPKITPVGEKLNILGKALKVFICFNLICFTWVFFRASSLAQANHIISSILSFGGGLTIKDTSVFSNLCFALLLLLIIEYLVLRKCNIENILSKYGTRKVTVFCAAMVMVMVLWGVSDGSQFIYFQF